MILSHPFDGVPTFALTDHTLEFVAVKHLLLQKIFQTLCSFKDPMIIICKGIQKSSGLEKCDFLYDGDWGDQELIEHEKFHKSLESSEDSWLGFDAPQSFGKFSGRDGKRT